jgi:hypothetical protein
MPDKNRRKEITDQYKQDGRQAGVYRIIHRESGRYFLEHSRDLRSREGRWQFALSTGSINFLDKSLQAMINDYGTQGFEFEILETLEPDSGLTGDKLLLELEALEALWREKLEKE